MTSRRVSLALFALACFVGHASSANAQTTPQYNNTPTTQKTTTGPATNPNSGGTPVNLPSASTGYSPYAAAPLGGGFTPGTGIRGGAHDMSNRSVLTANTGASPYQDKSGYTTSGARASSSLSGTGNNSFNPTAEICVVCHIPHGANGTGEKSDGTLSRNASRRSRLFATLESRADRRDLHAVQLGDHAGAGGSAHGRLAPVPELP